MLCSSPSSRICLRDDDHQRSAIDSMLVDDSTSILGINGSNGLTLFHFYTTLISSNSKHVFSLGESSSNQVLSLLGSSGLLSSSALLSSGLLGPSRSRNNHISDCFSDNDMELGVWDIRFLIVKMLRNISHRLFLCVLYLIFLCIIFGEQVSSCVIILENYWLISMDCA